MIAVFESKNALHIIKWTGRVRFHAESQGYCGESVDASNGVLQVPDAVFDSGASYNLDGKKLAACSRCRMMAQATVG